MRESFFEQGEIVNKKVEAINRELSDSGISHPSERRKALDLEMPLDGAEEKFKSQEHKEKGFEFKDFEKIFAHIEGSNRNPDAKRLQEFASTEDAIARLDILRTMSPSDAAQAIKDFGFTKSGYKYIADRLDFYQKLIQGQAVKRYKAQKWNSQKGEYEEVIKEYPIDPASTTPEDIRLGLLRDSMFAAMIGTPEMAIFKISSRQCKDRKIPTTHFPFVRGSRSCISESNSGWAYPFLRKTYEKARASVERRTKGQGREMDDQQIEHSAVMLASRWLTESMNYNRSDRAPESQYVSGNDEAIAWARLGEGVKKQLRGMRQKIRSVDLHNIERFIGKSGIDKYDPERKRLFGQLKFLKEGYDQDKKQEFTTKENQFAVQKQERWQEQEIERLTTKLEKQKREIAAANLPEDEALLQLESIGAKYNDRIAEIRREVEDKIAYYQNRIPEQLITDLEERQKLVEERHEKRKSLAQKALDLHFHYNHQDGGKSHRRKLQKAESDLYSATQNVERVKQSEFSDWPEILDTSIDMQEAIEAYRRRSQAKLENEYQERKSRILSRKDQIAHNFDQGDVNADPEQVIEDSLLRLKQWYDENKATEHTRLETFFARGDEYSKAILDVKKKEQAVENLKEGKEKAYAGVVDWINYAPLGTIKRAHNMLRKGVGDQTVMEISIADIVMGKNGVNRESLQSINAFFAELKTLEGVQKDKEKALEALNDRDWNDPERQKAQTEYDGANQKYNEKQQQIESLIRTGNIISGRGHALPLEELIEIAKKNTHGLHEALGVFKLEEVKQMLDVDANLCTATLVKESTSKLGYQLSFEEISEIARHNCNGLADALAIWSLEDVKKMLNTDVYLASAIHITRRIKEALAELGQNANHLSPEVLRKMITLPNPEELIIETIKAGFTPEEITRFPFLISPLVTRK